MCTRLLSIIFCFSTGETVDEITVRLGILGIFQGDITSVHQQTFNAIAVNLAFFVFIIVLEYKLILIREY